MKRVICLALILLLLCGCSASGQYVYTRAHVSAGSSTQTSDNGIGTREDLTSAISSMLRAAVESDTLMIYDYQGDLDTDLESITSDLTKSDPFGVYAVSSIVFKQVTILSRTELAVSIQYSRTEQEIASVVEAPTDADLALRITEALDNFSTGKAFYLEKVGIADPEALVQKCWLQNPANAVGLKDFSVASYPPKGESRILELKVEYLDNFTVLQKQREAIRSATAAVCAEYSGQSDRDKLDFIYAYLHDNVTYDTDAARVVAETGGRQAKTSLYTAYGALLENRAAQSGVALAAKALCDGLGLSSLTVCGTLDGEPYVWLVVSTEEGLLHFDPTSLLAKNGESTDSTNATEAEKSADYIYLFTAAEARHMFSWNKSLYGIY
ncbi:MAG: hypothetical protein VB086_07870 [Clostridiaceae bacterium]|nr:hypothetical protein [Clostridiaceae bacterium]